MNSNTNTTEKKKRNIKPIIVAGALVACLGIAGMSAYFTDAAKVTNTFTVGKVDITPHEPNWDPPTDIVPNQEFKKDPTVENVGNNAAYIFVQVKVPKAHVVYADQNGLRQNADKSQSIPLFTYNIDSAKWAEVPGTADDQDAYVTRTYVYGTTSAPEALEKTEETEPLFSTIKFANVIEGQEGIELQKLNVEVFSYAIQTTWLNDNENNGVDGEGATTPEAIWAILSKQNEGQPVPDVTDDVLTENEAAAADPQP